MDNDQILETVSDFLHEQGLTKKFAKWVEKQGFTDNEEFDLKEWIEDFGD
jgi:hypothetical protein